LTFQSRGNKVLTDVDVHKSFAETNFKAALTHPTIVQFFRKFHRENQTEVLLDFYLTAVEIREEYNKNRESGRLVTSYRKLQAFIQKFVLPQSSTFVPIKLHYRNMIMNNVQPNGEVIVERYPAAIEGLRLAQYEIFFLMKDGSWLLFCNSDLYRTMMKKKEVRTMISLHHSGPGSATVSTYSPPNSTVVAAAKRQRSGLEKSIRSTNSSMNELSGRISLKNNLPVTQAMIVDPFTMAL
jgi:hypothetical protein